MCWKEKREREIWEQHYDVWKGKDTYLLLIRWERGLYKRRERERDRKRKRDKEDNYIIYISKRDDHIQEIEIQKARQARGLYFIKFYLFNFGFMW